MLGYKLIYSSAKLSDRREERNYKKKSITNLTRPKKSYDALWAKARPPCIEIITTRWKGGRLISKAFCEIISWIFWFTILKYC